MKKLLTFVLALAASSASAQISPPRNSGGGTIASGSSISGCTINSIVYIDGSGNLACALSPVNGSVSTAGRSILTIKDTIGGASATDNFLNITGTFPATLSADTNAILLTLTTVNQNQNQSGIHSILSGNIGAGGFVTAVRGDIAASNGGGYAGGVFGGSTGVAAENVGVHGFASGGTGNVGGFFHLSSAIVPTGTAALIADNRSIAANIFEARDNGTAVFTIADAGASTFAAGVTFNGSQTVALNQSFAFGGMGSIYSLAVQTPDTNAFTTGATSNAWTVFEGGDTGFDFQNACTTGLGTAACTDPTLIIHSHNQDTGEFLSMAHDGKAGVIVGGNSTVLDGTIRLGGTVTLTESSATTVLTIPIPVSTGSGGFINYVVDARDATNVQIRSGNVNFAVANNSSGTETCNVFGVGPTTQAAGGDTTNAANPTQVQDGSGVGAITSGTLTYAWSVDTSGSNSCVLKLNAVSSLTQTTLQIHYTVISTGPALVTGG